MHLWPSMRIRDSFKHAYLEKLEWNIHRMNVKKKQQQNRSQSPTTSQDKLLDDTDNKPQGDDDGVVSDLNNRAGGARALCRELLMILSCCYCCFCCGDVSGSGVGCGVVKEKVEGEGCVMRAKGVEGAWVVCVTFTYNLVKKKTDTGYAFGTTSTPGISLYKEDNRGLSLYSF
ncbi:hypothetical protein RHSIM_Rhsim09G0151900 [Rhododendron simsii]|uniref:Uncharacterized protein n=1 Tax=Rhododendron simsii TaxID=118357 RepID=A0A834GHZ0_RHOSS|nr:hypothetical protein RHSIM_Rhsim09G0151900 [Rhododendron simsii]